MKHTTAACQHSKVLGQQQEVMPLAEAHQRSTYSESLSEFGAVRLLALRPSFDRSAVRLSSWLVSCWVFTCGKSMHIETDVLTFSETKSSLRQLRVLRSVIICCSSSLFSFSTSRTLKI
ncbi:hypothetical protein E2C01_021417 [Portunus trituberculatus]|uniref:Uncharacterized protein n=1 Tax=Portunus trituberculatus TaxID=210409 RepID=A0A5B7E2J6_PORTR|nr:hypothetical protein [Portunus trituberculatus]